MNVQYEQQGNYLIPCIRTKEQEEIHLGVLANRHRQYLKQNHKVRYYNLLTRERLYDYLDGVECQAEDLFEQTVKSLAEKEQVTEKLKAMNMMLWVQKIARWYSFIIRYTYTIHICFCFNHVLGYR